MVTMKERSAGVYRFRELASVQTHQTCMGVIARRGTLYFDVLCLVQ